MNLEDSGIICTLYLFRWKVGDVVHVSETKTLQQLRGHI